MSSRRGFHTKVILFAAGIRQSRFVCCASYNSFFSIRALTKASNRSRAFKNSDLFVGYLCNQFVILHFACGVISPYAAAEYKGDRSESPGLRFARSDSPGAIHLERFARLRFALNDSPGAIRPERFARSDSPRLRFARVAVRLGVSTRLSLTILLSVASGK